jgi:hypothetical protein
VLLHPRQHDVPLQGAIVGGARLLVPRDSPTDSSVRPVTSLRSVTASVRPSPKSRMYGSSRSGTRRVIRPVTVSRLALSGARLVPVNGSRTEGVPLARSVTATSSSSSAE